MAILSFGLKSAFKFSKLGTFLRKYRWNKAITNTERINRVISDYMGDISKEQRDELVKDILYMARGYRFSADEYFYYHFKDKPIKERLEFISNLNSIDYCESLNLAKNQAIFDSKLKSAEIFGKYYGREIQMIGFEIPMWKDAVKLAKELACVVKGNRYAGWDLALTENGWAMIEGNARGQFVWQIPRQKGFLKEANQILKRLAEQKLRNYQFNDIGGCV